VVLGVTATAAERAGFETNGSPRITVQREGDNVWSIQGQRTALRVEGAGLGLTARVSGHLWHIEGSSPDNLRVRTGSKSTTLGLGQARRIEFEPYRTGYSAGVKVSLGDFADGTNRLDLALTLLITLEGPGEDIVGEILAAEGETRLRELRWPGVVASNSFDATVVPFMQGMFLPKNWPAKTRLYDTLSFGRGLYLPCWGQIQGDAGMLTVLETPDDAGCDFVHPGGGPTRMGPRWVDSLGHWGYPRRVRMCFTDGGGYVALAKRYRQHAIAAGRFVSLREKIARNPRVAELVGAPVIHTSILYHIQPESSYYSKDKPEANHQWVAFEARALELEKLAATGFDRAYVHLDGWGVRGYDNLHPDVLPPSPEAGGWEGMKRFGETCARLGYVFAIHDQYRDYYLDAASYDARHAVRDENGTSATHSTWYGGRQTLLCARLAPGHVRKNHQAILDHGVPLRGVYLDVFSVVPPDPCYAPEHPVTRSECLRYRAEALDSVRTWGGVVSSEEPSDWSVPHLDLVHHGPYPLDPGPGQGPAMGIPIPFFNLVYHDALLMPWSLSRGAWGIPEKDLGYLHALGNAGMPYLSLAPDETERRQVRTLCALHRRVGLIEMTGHRFLDDTRRRQEFTYADGTDVRVDFGTDSFEIQPPLLVE
jgi:hypothetical protein